MLHNCHRKLDTVAHIAHHRIARVKFRANFAHDFSLMEDVSVYVNTIRFAYVLPATHNRVFNTVMNELKITYYALTTNSFKIL